MKAVGKALTVLTDVDKKIAESTPRFFLFSWREILLFRVLTANYPM